MANPTLQDRRDLEMRASATATTQGDDAAPAADPSALAWVHDELRRTLEGAQKLLRRFLRESEAHAGSDVSARDLAPVRQARAQIHQAAGALAVVDLVPAAQVLAATDAALRTALDKPARLNAALLEKIEQASFAVVDFLGRQVAGKPVSSLLLFPQARALLELAGAERVHPADLWAHDWHWRVLPDEAGVAPRAADAQSLAALEQLSLATMKTPGPASLAAMGELCAGLAAGATQAHLRSLWQLAAAVFEAQAHGLLQPDVFSKRLASRLLSQLRAMVRGDGRADPLVMQRLAQDLLFFCAQSVAPDALHPSPRLAAVRAAHGLSDAAPADYNSSPLGRFDPALVVQARKRVLAAKDSWSAVAAGDMHRLAGLAEQFSLVGESLRRLFPDGNLLADELLQSVAQLQRGSGSGITAPRAALAMEVATGLLYVEAALEESDFATPDPARPIARLAERIASVRAGGPPEAMEPWMEALYARVSDRQTLGTVVQELRASLASAEQQIDQFFRNPHERGALLPVPGTLQAMRGVLSVLGIDHASVALLHMREEIEALAAGNEPDDSGAPLQVRFERLAGNLGALGFLIDMLGVQAQLAKALFRFDPSTGTLAPVMGRATAALPLQPPRELPVLQDEVPPAATLPKRNLEVAAPSLTPPRAAPTFLPEHLATRPLPLASAPPAMRNALPDATDAEMRAIFFEEAQEVLQAARDALGDWDAAPRELEPVTRLRRAFHTLKGSARMVGLADFGDAAWTGEQAYTARLADNTPVNDRLANEAQGRADAALRIDTATELDRLATWIDHLAGGGQGRPLAAAEPAPATAPVAVTGSFESTVPVALEASAVAPVGAPAVDLDLDFDLDWTDVALPASEIETIVVTVPGALTSLVLDEEGDADEANALQPSHQAVPATLAEPLGFPADLPSAADLDLAPLAAMPVPQPPQPPIEPTPSVTDVEPAWVEDIGRTLTPPAPAEDLSFLSLDLSEPLPVPPPPAAQTAPVASTEQPVPQASAVRELDPSDDPSLLSLFEGLTPTPTTETALEPALLEPVTDAAGLLVDLAIDAAPAAEPAPLPAAEATELADVSELTDAFETAGTADAVAPPATSLPSVEVTELEAPSEEAGDSAQGESLVAADEDNIKVVGPLRIAIPLFNIYLNEADELSRRLATELAEWAMERHLPLPDGAIEHAHSLAGNSSTVGYAGLCELARALEHALVRMQALGQRGVTGSVEEAQLFVDAADEIRRLLHQFAAGFLKAPAPDLLQRLADHEHRSAQRLQTAALAGEPADAVADEAAWLAGISAEDHVDPDLFPIFEEEAQDLLPQLAAALRDWAQRPDDLGAADAAMRHLHTFKGGARLAGAMRLGELAHRLETRIERLATGGVAAQPSDIESLLAGSDALQHAFESLRESDARAYAAADAQALAQPAEAAPVHSPASTVALPATAPALASTQTEEPDAAASAENLAEPVAVVAPPEAIPATSAAAASTTPTGIDWARFDEPPPAGQAPTERNAATSQAVVRVRASLLERMVNQAGEVNISRARMEVEVGQVRSAMLDLSENLERLRKQLRDIELQAETHIGSRLEATKAAAQAFDPLEFDQFTRFQELTRMMAESVNDVATVQRTLKRTVERAEDELAAQTRLTRDLQADLLRTRMVEFDTLAERLHRVVRQAAKETGKQIRLDIAGGGIELDRGMLERLTPAFEHLVRNAVTHGIESPAGRNLAGKSPVGGLLLSLSQHGNEVGIDLQDDGAGLDLARIRAKAEAQGLVVAEGQEAELIFNPGFSTADKLTELAGRGVGLDVVRTEVMAVGGRVEVSSQPGKGTLFSLLLPLTTAVTQVLMLRCGDFTVAVPATLVDRVRRVGPDELAAAQATGRYAFGDQMLPFYWLGGLLQHSGGSSEAAGRTSPVVVVRSAQQRLSLHVDEVLGHQEAVVKNLGPQLSRMPGLAGMSVLASGTVALIYNPLVLAAVYGEAARALSLAAPAAAAAGVTADSAVHAGATAAPLVLVVDDSLTVRRVTQRLLVREGYRVQLAKDGLEALERVAEERPRLVLSDIEMPRMDGFDLVRRLRSDAALAALPVVMISSRIAQKHRDHAATLGVDHYLGKPYGEDELLALVARYTRPDALSAPSAAVDFTTA